MTEWKEVKRPGLIVALEKISQSLREISEEIIRRDAERLLAMTIHLTQREKEQDGDLATIQPE